MFDNIVYSAVQKLVDESLSKSTLRAKLKVKIERYLDDHLDDLFTKMVEDRVRRAVENYFYNLDTFKNDLNAHVKGWVEEHPNVVKNTIDDKIGKALDDSSYVQQMVNQHLGTIIYEQAMSAVKRAHANFVRQQQAKMAKRR